MGVPWKKIGGFLLGGVKKAAEAGVIPIPGLALGIEFIEEIKRDAPGVEKKQAVEAISDATLNALVLLKVITADQAEKLKTARSEMIDLYVAARNAEAEYHEAAAAMRAVIASFKLSPEAETALVGGISLET